MPIRVKELVVKTNVAKGETEKNSTGNLTEKDLFKLRDWVMEECMDEVNKLLEKRKLK